MNVKSFDQPVKSFSVCITPVAWFALICLLTWAMIMIGGYTRLMHAGLSMVDWKPVTGIIPPLNSDAWLAEFNKYKLFPEFQDVNFSMTLKEFKGIYLIEYSHRVFGRMLGLVFILPFIWFALKKQLSKSIQKRCLVMLAFGCIQGLMGWYMVKSGLVKDPAVSHYQLAAHLLLAFIIFGLSLWNILEIKGWKREKAFTPWLILGAVVITVTYGAFVAGLKAGMIYNTFPKMGEYWLAEEWNFMTPLWLNFLENHATVQFMHRILAISTFVFIIIYWWKNMSAKLARGLLAVSAIQVLLGVATLVMYVPVFLGILHQGWAVIVFMHAVMLCYGKRNTKLKNT